MLKPLDYIFIIQSLFYIIFFISSFKALIFLEWEYQIFEYFKNFIFLLAKFYFISLLQKIFWIFVQAKENVQII